MVQLVFRKGGSELDGRPIRHRFPSVSDIRHSAASARGEASGPPRTPRNPRFAGRWRHFRPTLTPVSRLSCSIIAPVEFPSVSLPDLLQHPSADPVSLYLTSLPSPASRRSMTASLQALSGLARDLSGQTGRVDWTALDPATATALRAACRSRWAPATTNRRMACLRGVVKVSAIVFGA